MKTDDLKLISQIGKALYASPAVAQSRSLETVAALTTLERLTDEESFEKVTQLLLARAEKDGTKATADAVWNPFFRLSPLERTVLAFLHSGKISYKRLSKLLGLEVDELCKIAWHARTKVACSPEVRMRAPHPTGSSKLKHACPEYDQDRPWTQKLLDDEMNATELTFIQNHTVACESCLRALKQAREFYYAVESRIPGVGGVSEAESKASENVLTQARLRMVQPGAKLSFGETLLVFFSRPEIVFTLFGLIAFLIFYSTR